MIEKIIQDKVGRLVIVNKLRLCKNEIILSFALFWHFLCCFKILFQYLICKSFSTLID